MLDTTLVDLLAMHGIDHDTRLKIVATWIGWSVADGLEKVGLDDLPAKATEAIRDRDNRTEDAKRYSLLLKSKNK